MISISIALWLTGVATGYFVKGMRKPKCTKPKPNYCSHEWTERKKDSPWDEWSNYTCLRIHNACRSGFCEKHCKSQGCDCLKALDKAERELLDEFRKLS
jgi:hypothetical protein